MKSKKFQAGMAVRRRVLGDEHVDRAISKATAFSLPLQDMVTENCWGETWVSGVLPDQTRSLITIAILAALKAPTELKGHVRGALRNGCSMEEIRDVLMHSTIYCGIPAGVDAFRAASEVMEAWQENSNQA